MEDDLEQQVAQFLAQILAISMRNGVGDFESLFDRVWSNRREILLEVPRTACVRRAQRRHDVEKAHDVAGFFHRGARQKKSRRCWAAPAGNEGREALPG